jgi:hypothetical protein
LTLCEPGAIKIQLSGGAVAQLEARLDGIEEVVGSNPIGSTNDDPHSTAFINHAPTAYGIVSTEASAAGLRVMGQCEFRPLLSRSRKFKPTHYPTEGGCHLQIGSTGGKIGASGEHLRSIGV